MYSHLQDSRRSPCQASQPRLPPPRLIVLQVPYLHRKVLQFPSGQRREMMSGSQERSPSLRNQSRDLTLNHGVITSTACYKRQIILAETLKMTYSTEKRN